MEGQAYLNCGDFIESFTAVVETLEGRFALLDVRRLMSREGPEEGFMAARLGCLGEGGEGLLDGGVH